MNSFVDILNFGQDRFEKVLERKGTSLEFIKETWILFNETNPTNLDIAEFLDKETNGNPMTGNIPVIFLPPKVEESNKLGKRSFSLDDDDDSDTDDISAYKRHKIVENKFMFVVVALKPKPGQSTPGQRKRMREFMAMFKAMAKHSINHDAMLAYMTPNPGNSKYSIKEYVSKDADCWTDEETVLKQGVYEQLENFVSKKGSVSASYQFTKGGQTLDVISKDFSTSTITGPNDESIQVDGDVLSEDMALLYKQEYQDLADECDNINPFQKFSYGDNLDVIVVFVEHLGCNRIFNLRPILSGGHNAPAKFQKLVGDMGN